MNIFVIDASAWIEYFNGTDKGEKVKEIVENKGMAIYTNTITISEMAYYFVKRRFDFQTIKSALLSITDVYTVSADFAEEAGILHSNIKKERKSMSMADTYVLLTAKKLGGKVITADKDFLGFKEAVIIK